MGTALSSDEKSVIIPLSRGLTALISIEDADRVLKHKWSASEPYPGKLYGCAQIDDKFAYLHRFILNPPKGVKVDHRDGNGLDCRRDNLRQATSAQNSQNNRVSKRSRLGLRGVHERRRSGLYFGAVRANGKSYYTKSFPCPILAAAARDVLAQSLHGEFCVPNFRFIPVPVAGA